MGYQEIEIPGNSVYTLFTPTFDKINGKMTLSDIIVCDKDGNEYDGTHATIQSGKVTVRKLKNGTVVKVDTTINYTQNNKWGTKGTTTIDSGESIIFQNKLTESIKLRVSGQVVTRPIFEVPGDSVYTLFGNNTPVDMTLADIKAYDQDGNEYDGTHATIQSGKLTARKLKEGTVVKVDTTINYTQNNKWGTKGSTVIKAGEGIIIQNKLTTPIYLMCKKPVD